MRNTGACALITLVLVCGAAPAIGAQPAQRSGPDSPALEEFGRYFADAVRDYGVVGASIAVVHGPEVIHRQQAGLSDLALGRAVGDETIFHWASITKTLTAVAIMQLRDRGRLSLDDPVVTFLPEVRAVHDPFGPIEAVTIRHLLSHTSGFRGATWPWGGERWQPFEPTSWSQLVAMLPYTRIEFPPGSRFSYSNPGIVFLGRIIEVISGDDYETYIQKHIFAPLGMTRSYFDTTAPFLRPDRSRSYRVADGAVSEGVFDADTGITVSNGGLNAPVADLVKWTQFLLGTASDAAVRARYDTVLARATLREMWEPRAPCPAEEASAGGPVHVGLGFFLEDHGGRRWVAHSGDQNFFETHLYLRPEEGLGYVVAFNTWVSRTGKSPRTTATLDRAVRDRLFTQVFPALASATRPSAPAYDFVITNGRIVDGTGTPAFTGDVAVRDGRIAAVGAIDRGGASRVIDARGRVIAPGFIDVHGHLEDSLDEHPDAANFIRMGVTSAVTGNCGFSAVPLGAWFARLEARRPAINVASLVGHNTVRRAAMKGDFDRPPTGEELARMRALVADDVASGAVGFSSGLEYVPGAYAKLDELAAVAAEACRAGGVYASHMRDEGNAVEAAIEETIAVGERAGCPVEISHFKISAKSRWGASAKTTALVEAARAGGVRVTVDQYAYTAGSTFIDIIFPAWVFDGGDEPARARMTDAATRTGVAEGIVQKAAAQGFDDLSFVQITSYPANPAYNGMRLPDIAAAAGKGRSVAAQAEMAIDMRLAGGAGVVVHKMSAGDVDRIMAQPYTMIGSDSDVLDPADGSRPHPRGYGNNARILAHYVRERHLLGLEEAVRKMTALPAETFGLNDRGVIEPGRAADLVVFDPAAVADRATFDTPHRYATGFDLVVVNGHVVIDEGRETGARPGRVLRRSGSRGTPARRPR
jgi:N-acyl-D-amino-acid deacylase